MTSLLVLALFLGPAGLQDPQKPKPKPPPKGVRIFGHAGWGQRTVPGRKTPVHILVENRTDKNRELVLDASWALGAMRQGTRNPGPNQLLGRAGPTHRIPLSVATGTRKRVYLTLQAPDRRGYSVWVYARDAKTGRIHAQGELPARFLEPRQKLVAVIGSDRPAGFPFGDIQTAWISPDLLPEEWQGFGSLHALLWLDANMSEVSQAQIDALDTWVSSGGHLVVASSTGVNITGTDLEPLLPAAIRQGREVDELTALASIPYSPGSPPDGRAPVLDSRIRRGKILLSQDDIPLVIDAPRNGGRTTLVAFDPARAPFLKWRGATAFWSWILDAPTTPTPEPEDDRTLPAPQLGSHSLAEICTSFPDVAPPSIGGLLGLILLYLVVVGPLDYFLLRALRRLEWTWFSFPSYVLVFSGLILVIGGAFMSRAAYQRDIVVEDYYPGSEDFCHRRAIGAILAPAEGAYDVESGEPFSSNFLSTNSYAREFEDLNGVSIDYGARTIQRGWFLQRGATGLALLDDCTAEPPPLEYSLKSGDADWATVTVRNATGETFEAGWLVTKTAVYPLDAMPPGESTFEVPPKYRDVRTFARTEGMAPVILPKQPEQEYYAYAYEEEVPVRTKSEAKARLEAEQLMRGLTFGEPAGRAPGRDLTGLSRDLKATDWLDAGGTILLARRRGSPSPFTFTPTPSRHTSVVLTRIFQEREP